MSQLSSVVQAQSTMGSPLVLSNLPGAYERRYCSNAFQMYRNAQLSAVFLLPVLFEALFIWECMDLLNCNQYSTE